MSVRLDLLVVVAHPDDEGLCAAGTMALCAGSGQKVGVVCATRGERGPISDPTLADRTTLASVRERELRASCAALGVSHLEFLGWPDGDVAAIAAQDRALRQLVDCLCRLRPRVLIGFGPDGLYGHLDHVAIGELTRAARAVAAAPAGLEAGAAAHRVSRHFYAIWTAEQVAALLAASAHPEPPGQLWGLQPGHFVVGEAAVTARIDVRSVMAEKLRALRCHRTQLADDHAFRRLTEPAAARVLGVERFRCADGSGGDPLEATALPRT